MFWPWDPLGTPLGPQGVPRGSQGGPKGVSRGCQGRFQGYSESSYACPTNEKVANPLRRGVDFIKWCFLLNYSVFLKYAFHCGRVSIWTTSLLQRKQKVVNRLRRGVDFMKSCFFSEFYETKKLANGCRGVSIWTTSGGQWTTFFYTWDPLGTPLGVPRTRFVLLRFLHPTEPETNIFCTHIFTNKLSPWFPCVEYLKTPKLKFLSSTCTNNRVYAFQSFPISQYCLSFLQYVLKKTSISYCIRLGTLA